jgi:uncharacterized protein
VSAPELTTRRASQRYTLLKPGTDDEAPLYRYESGSFRADLTVDGDGYVTDYPGLWRRVWPSEGAVA